MENNYFFITRYIHIKTQSKKDVLAIFVLLLYIIARNEEFQKKKKKLFSREASRERNM